MVSNIVCFNIIIIENSEMIAISHRYFILFRTNVDLIMMYVKIVTAAAAAAESLLTLTDELINAGTDVS